MTALHARQFRAAIALFQQSYALRPSPVVLYNQALACRGDGRYFDAIRLLERYLTAPSQSATRDDLIAVAQEIEQLRARLPVLLVDVIPRNAAVTLDATTNLSALSSNRVDPGEHLLEIELDGFRSESRRVVMRPGQTQRVAAELVSADVRPRLAVDPRIETAEVEIDGVAVGRGPVEVVTSPGPHVVTVRAPGFVTQERTVQVTSRGRTAIRTFLQTEQRVPTWVIGVSAGGAAAVILGLSVAIAVASSPTPRVPMDITGWQGNFMEAR